MNEPFVAAIMLTRDRPAMARRAVESFRAQTYGNRILLIWDTGKQDAVLSPLPDRVWHMCFSSHVETIGKLRNNATSFAAFGPDPRPEIIVHWDDDDYSHPNRIAEQVALLQSSGADAVGYREMLFWCDLTQPVEHFPGAVYRDYDPQAWLYSHHRPDHALGTSLCYWRKTWEHKPFPDLPKGPGATGEDWQWQQGLKVVGASSVAYEPRMIASIHGGNSSQAYDLDALVSRNTKDWRRVPEWDDYCRERMKL